MKGLRALELGTVAAIALAACNLPAQAADLPSRALTPLAPAEAAPIWTGFYIGASAGADILKSRYATTGLPGLGLPPDGTYPADFSQTNPRLGLYLGYNYQIANYVIGLEGDAAYDFGRTKTTTGIPGTVTFVAPPIADSLSASSKYDASIRGRAGYLVTPTILAYATGGVAFRDASYTASCPATGVGSYCTFPEFENYRKTLVGYTVGAGLEGYIAPNLLLRGEYRYSDFTNNHTFFANSPLAGVDAIGSHMHLSASTVTAGLAYQFNMMPVPVVAKY